MRTVTCNKPHTEQIDPGGMSSPFRQIAVCYRCRQHCPVSVYYDISDALLLDLPFLAVGYPTQPAPSTPHPLIFGRLPFRADAEGRGQRAPAKARNWYKETEQLWRPVLKSLSQIHQTHSHELNCAAIYTPTLQL